MKKLPKKSALCSLLPLLLLLIPDPAHANVLCGIDVLERDNFASLTGAHVALITNHTGRDLHGRSTADLFHQAPALTLVCVMTPEHGFRGTVEHGVSVQSTIDEKTGIPVYSLYGATTRPTIEMLQGADTIVFDIQDIGTRFYTYIATMGQALEVAADQKLRFIVLDRPNPIRGDITEGDILDPDVKRLTGYFPIPIRHGLTTGELAHWMNETQGLKANLTVIKMEGWKRSMWFDDTNLRFRPTSPNMRSLTSALLYCGMGCFEATNVSVGRGTKAPFQLFGAPWMNGKSLAAHLSQAKIPGLTFRAVRFIPKKDLYKNERCEGIRISIKDQNAARPFQLFLQAFLFIYQNCPAFKPNWEEVRVVTGSNLLKEACEKKEFNADALLKAYEKKREEFQNQVSALYLY
ncbi:MAG: DUF1343 domain-containing protein [Elusimicrobia bacterium]|nr:DUF1343 domain-containing protein [Candidatus Obscuribacterium magneticum]